MVRWVWFVVYTVIAVALVAVLMTDLFNPASGGVQGTAVITHRDANLKFRPCFGNFVSADGTVRLTNVQIGGEDNSRPGLRFTAFGNAAEKSITVPSGSEHATDISLSAGLIVAWLPQFYFLIYRPRKRHRAAVA